METTEIARLEAILGGDPGGPAFPALAEANRRAGRLEEAERVAREGLQRHPAFLAGRVVLALALLDLGRLAEARSELEGVLEHVPDHPLALDALASAGGAAAADSLEALDDAEIEGAFEEAETPADEMVDANSIAAAALRAAELDTPEGVLADPASPFATGTVADLLERQGHGAEAAAVRRELQRRSDRGDETLAGPQKERLIATLELWLENLRRARR